MFSPSRAEGGPATATRSRRRQRPRNSEDVAQQPKAKRQRLPLTEQTFVNPEEAPEPVQEAAPPPKNEKPVRIENKTETVENVENINPTPRRETTNGLRVKKPKHGDRAANKGDGSVVLTSTSAYTVSKLPALPDRIRSDWTGPQNADVSSVSGYALSITPTHAIVWPYTSTSPSPETFTFTLPSASKPSDPLPVGSLVSPSASSTDPGLVVVMAGSGKIVYWEAISSAATFAFIKKDRSGVESVINGMMSGEKVVAITNAEPAGFILTFNTGRLAYMTVRDSHGRPAIAVRFLRTSFAAATTNGIFGSIRHAFSNLSLRGHVAAVRADRSTRVGERNIVALTAKGRLQSWTIHRGGQEKVLGSCDAREDLIAALRENDPVSCQFPEDSFEALDFTFVPKGLEHKYLELSRLSDAMTHDDPSVQHLLLLVSLTSKSTSRYAMIEVIQTSNECKIGMIRPITSYSTSLPISESQDFLRPRIYLPRPALVAFAVFGRAAVIASVAVPPESPDAQLQSDNHIVPASFEDVIDFEQGSDHEIIGSGFEELNTASGHDEGKLHRHRSKNPATILVVRGAGVIRVVTTDIDKFASDQSPQVTAKSKLEQAVFFGRSSDNPLTFERRREIEFSSEELASAALEVSHEILASTTTFISTLPAALEDNLQERSKALERLITHLRSNGAELDRATRWSLLHNAEKMHVAQMLWKLHEQFTGARPTEDKKSLIALIVEFIHRDQKHKPQRHLGQLDTVRHWFINDVYRLEIMVAWAYEVIKTLYKGGILEESKMTWLMHEAMQVNLATQRGALEFRERHLASYGLGAERLKNGILIDRIQDLPEPWTGCFYVANNIKRLSDMSWEWVKARLSEDKARSNGNNSDLAIVEEIIQDIPSLTDRMLTSTNEFAIWAELSSDQKDMARNFINAYNTDRYEKPVAFAKAGWWDEAAFIAEKHKSLDALAVILLDHIQDLEAQIAESPNNSPEKRALVDTRQSKKTQLEASMERYGQLFAFPLYEYLLTRYGVDSVLSFELDKRGFKTKFLRTKPELARIAWINEIQSEKDVARAANTLVDLGLNKEQQVWNKKIELSLGKLALLAQAEEAGELKVDEAANDEKMKQVDKELITVKIQDQLFGLISPCTREAVDEAAALNFAMETHSMNIPRRHKALHQLFELGMKRLLNHEALDAMTLIELLTLISLSPEAKEEIANPFWLALKVAESSCHKDELKEAKKLIWRRVLIRDDWSKINDTTLKDDRQVVERLADTELFSFLVDCIKFENSQDPFRPMPVMDAVGAFTKELDRRCNIFDASFQSKIKDMMKAEDKTLLQYIEKSQLVGWANETFKAAQTEVNELADEATQAGAAR